jgi:hypothetical protein
LVLGRANADKRKLLHTGDGFDVADVFRLQKDLEFAEGQLIVRFILAVVFMLLLDGIVGEVPINICRIVVKLFAAGA